MTGFPLALRLLLILALVAGSITYAITAFISAISGSHDNFEVFLWTGLILLCGWVALHHWEERIDADCVGVV